MNSTTSRLATVLAGAVAITGAVLGVAASAAEPEPTGCQQAVVHADALVALQGDVTGGLAAYDVARDLGLANAETIRVKLETAQRDYAAELAAYQTAAAACR